MTKIFLKAAWRNIIRNKTSAFINISGLALGICAFFFLVQYISLEKSVNRFHRNLADLYRLINLDVTGKTWTETEPGWADIFKHQFPEIKDACRFDEETGSTIIGRPDSGRSFSESETGYADGNFFRFFSFRVTKGDAASLSQPNTIFLSESRARKYFGDEDPIGKTVVVNNQFGSTLYTVGAVYADMGDNSDIRFNVLFSLETLKNPANLNNNDWASLDNLSSQYINTYVALAPNVNIPSLENKLSALRTELRPRKDGVAFRLQSLSDIHLGRSLDENYPVSSSLKNVYLLSVITLLILLIAWFNYVNLSTANGFRRASEVGIRKVVGASRGRLAVQFLGESLVTNLLAFFIAGILVTLLQPLFNDLVGKHLSWRSLTQSPAWIVGLFLLFAGAILSGAYTAFSLSAYKPVETLKGKITNSVKGIFLRKSLVVAQFSISMLLIIATMIIYRQLGYMQNKKLGLNPNQLLVIRGPLVGNDSTFNLRRAAFEEALSHANYVLDFSASGSVPSGNFNFMNSGITQPASVRGDELKAYSFVIIDERYLPTYQIRLLAGRNFSNRECNVKWNDNSKILINEAAARQLGFNSPDDALRTPVKWHGRKFEVIGVVSDYNHTSAKFAVSPMIFYPQHNTAYYTIRLSPDHLAEKIANLEREYGASFAGNPFDYFFIDESFNKLYATERQYVNIFTVAALWGICIACMGLFGLVSFSVQSRIKEIGIRKVLGANVSEVFLQLTKGFLILVCISFVIAAPLGWVAMNGWLRDFAYRVSLPWWVFLGAGLATLLIALATISVRAIRAANANPIESLRTE